MMWVLDITFLLLTLSTVCYGENPGAKIQMTEDGLGKGVEYLLNKMMSNNTIYEIPDVKGSENIASEDIGYAFTNIRLVELNLGTVSSKWLPETGMQVSMKNGSATINCNWKLDSWLLRDSGSSILTLTGASISITMGIRRIDPGAPSIYLIDCQSSVQDVDAQILDGVSYIADTIKQPIETVVQSTVSMQLCSTIRDQVKKWDQSISNLKLNLSLNHLMEMDLSLVGNPEISDHDATIGLKGIFRSYNESDSETSFTPAPITLPVQHGAMVYIGISQASLNSLCSAYYSSGFLTFLVSHVVGSKQLTTSELSAYMPEISQRFPNPAPVKFQMYATRSPLVFLKVNNMTIQLGGSVQAYAYPLNAEPSNIFSVNVMASFEAGVIVSEAKGAKGLNLTGSVNLDRLQLEGSQPASDVKKRTVTESQVEQLFHEMIIPVINEELQKGVFMSSHFLKNATASIQEGFATLAADLKEKPTNV